MHWGTFRLATAAILLLFGSTHRICANRDRRRHAGELRSERTKS